MASPSSSRRIYAIQIDVFALSSGYDFPIKQYRFLGRSQAEAEHNHELHLLSDSFLRGCLEKDAYRKQIPPCQAIVTRGWVSGKGLYRRK